MKSSRDEVMKEFFDKGISPTIDANDWIKRPTELSDLAVYAKHSKVRMTVENSDVLEQSHKEELKFVGKQWVILK